MRFLEAPADPNAPAPADAQTGPQPPEDFATAFAPDAANPFSWKWAGHLLRRAAFGPTPDKLRDAVAKQPGQVVDELFAYDPATDIGGLNAFLEQASALYDIRRGAHMVVEWWFHRMIHTPFPAQERLALFWHDHFATSAGKVGRADWMHDQIELFRTQGKGSFRDMLIAVGRQPAMLRWLDGHASHKNSPNENYAREILELFTMGVDQYTEKDIQELARAFTGWLINGNEGRFDPNRFDEGEKTVFGETAAFNDESAVDLILKQDRAGKFVAGRLLQCYVHPNPREEHVAHFAQRLRDHNWVIGEVLKEILKSKLFYSDWAYRSRIKEPVELLVGACLALDGKPRADWCRSMTERMGQKLLYPPDVSGWKGNTQWINANTVMVRFRFGHDMAQQGFQEFVSGPMFQYLEKHQLNTPDKILNEYSRLLLDNEVPAEIRGKLLDYITRDMQNQPADFKFDYNTVQHKVRGMVQLMTASPQFQLA